MTSAGAIPVVAALVIGCSMIGGLPPDVARLGDLRIVAAEEAGATISAAQAIEAAAAAGHHGDRSPSAYLVALAHPQAGPSGIFIGRDVAWLLRWEGNFEFSRPGADASPRPSHFLYVFVDAHSGSVLDARYLE